jgi:hypothetical protein
MLNRLERIERFTLPSLLACALCGCTDTGGDPGDTDGSSSSSTGAGPTTGPSPTTQTSTSDTSSSGATTDDASSSTTTGDETGNDDTTSTGGDDSTSTGDVETEVTIERIGRYAPADPAAAFDEGAAEIAAFDPGTDRLFVTNGQTGEIDILDLSDPTSPSLVSSFGITSKTLGSPTSVAVHGTTVAAAFPSSFATAAGSVVFFDTDGTELASVAVGVLPDMLTFSPDGNRVLVANEGEPEGYADGQADPVGSVSIIDVSGDIASLTDDDVTQVGFGALTEADLDDTTRVFGPEASIAEDFEPEYVTLSADSTTAWVALQENNAMAQIDVAAGTVTSVTGLGWVDHSMTGLDPSNDDGAIAIATHPVFGMRQPDAIAAFEVGGTQYVVTANEGDAREYDGFDEQERIRDLTLDPTVFPTAKALQDDAVLGRLRVTSALGDVDGDDDYDALYAYGSRSISIFDVTAAPSLVWDSGDQIEQAVAEAFPDDFNSNNDENDSFDARSDDKGPEPEGLAVGEAFGTPYVFVGLERVGGLMIWDLSDPTNPAVFDYINPRDFAGVAADGTADDLGPEGVVFVAAEDSPSSNPLVIVTNEVSGSVSIYEMAETPVR